ncbi:MAG: lipopolysaccharide biosynthesis protein [Chloroflexota bacterium]
MPTKHPLNQSSTEATSRNGHGASPRALLHWLAHPGPSLSQRVVHAGFWVFALRGAERLLVLARVVILARILAPQDFGLLGIALLTMASLDTLSKTGFGVALLQKKGNITDYLDTVWTVQACRGALEAMILFLAAGYVADFFRAPAATPVLQVMAATSVIKGLTNVGIVYFQKDLEFSKYFVWQISRSITSVGVAIALALLFRSVWALVFGVLAGDLVALFVSYAIQPYRPRVRFEIRKAKELFTFGRWVYVDSVVSFGGSQLDSAVLGRLLGPVSLGLYSMGSRMSSMLIREAERGFSTVAFPAYSKLQDELPRLRLAFLRTVESTACMAFPMAVVLLLLAEDLVRVALGTEWLPAASAMKILALAGAARSLIGINGALLKGVGRPRLDVQLNALLLAGMIAAIYPLTNLMGIAGSASAVLLAVGITLPFSFRYVTTILDIGAQELLGALFAPLSISFAMMLVTLAAKQGFHTATFPALVAVAGLNLLVYIGMSHILWRRFKSGPVHVLIALKSKGMVADAGVRQ